MRFLKVHNFGPIKEVNIQLKEYNFFIGGQGVGKSTLAKLLSIVSELQFIFSFNTSNSCKKMA